jgi:Acetyltransferase (GNAT) domain
VPAIADTPISIRNVTLSRQFVSFSDEIATEWDRLVSSSPDGWVFSLAAWQRLILAVPRWALRDHSFAVYENGRMVAAMPLQWSPHSNRMTSSGWGGSGPVIAGDLKDAARERVLRYTLDHAKELAIAAGATILDFAISPVTKSSLSQRWGVNPFVFYGYQDLSQISQVIDLSKNEAELLAPLSSKTKRILKDARDKGIEVRQVDWPEYLDDYYDAHQETYTRTGVSPHPKEYFSGIANEIARSGHAVLLAAFSHTGEAVGFINCARFGGSAYYHTGCSRASALDSGANHLLLWSAILAAKKDGCFWFDVGAVDPCSDNAKLRGLTVFKSRFGGEPHRLIRAEMALAAAPSATIASPAAVVETMPEPALVEPKVAPGPPEPSREPVGLLTRAGRLVRQLRGG